MLEKEVFIEKLKKSIRIERAAVVLYTKHTNNKRFLAGFDEEAREKVRAILEELTEGSKKHKKTFEELLDKVKGSNKDVY